MQNKSALPSPAAPFSARKGAVGNANAGESKHKEVKKSAASSSGRDNPEHIYRSWNDSQALKALCDGVKWWGTGFHMGQAVRRELTPGLLCRQVLQEVFKILPLQMNPASKEEGATLREEGRPHGYQQWDGALLPCTVDTLPPPASAWQQEVCRTLPSAHELETCYDKSLGCGRTEEDAACSSHTCSYCWRNRGKGLVRREVVVFNHWGKAPAEISAGTGILRGSPVKNAASTTGWTRSVASRANDIEIYLTDDARRSESRGLGYTTLGRVAYFFEHQGNEPRRGEEDTRKEGVFTIWVAVSEYVTAGVGNKRKVDPVTGLAEFRMRQALTFYPASAIRCVVHMMHACTTTGASACGLGREGGTRTMWRCTVHKNSTYLLNKYFHSVGRDSIA